MTTEPKKPVEIIMDPFPFGAFDRFSVPSYTSETAPEELRGIVKVLEEVDKLNQERALPGRAVGEVDMSIGAYALLDKASRGEPVDPVAHRKAVEEILKETDCRPRKIFDMSSKVPINSHAVDAVVDSLTEHPMFRAAKIAARKLKEGK